MFDGGVGAQAPCTVGHGLAKPESVEVSRLLASLPPDEYRRLVPHLEAHPMILKAVLYKPGEVVDAGLPDRAHRR